MSFLTVFSISFGLIFLAELGDKTQLMVFALALRYGGRPVLLGACLAFALLSGSAVLVGRGFAELLSPDVLSRISGWVFILFGLVMLFRKEEPQDGTGDRKQSGRAGALAAFSLIAVSEMGDKTQVATLLLSVKYQSFIPVFFGSFFALSVASVIGVYVARRLHGFIRSRYITTVSGLLFVLLGAATLIVR